MASAKPDCPKIMISGAPASGKGTQCELITKKVRSFLGDYDYYYLGAPISFLFIITDVNNVYDDKHCGSSLLFYKHL